MKKVNQFNSKEIGNGYEHLINHIFTSFSYKLCSSLNSKFLVELNMQYTGEHAVAFNCFSIPVKIANCYHKATTGQTETTVRAPEERSSRLDTRLLPASTANSSIISKNALSLRNAFKPTVFLYKIELKSNSTVYSSVNIKDYH